MPLLCTHYASLIMKALLVYGAFATEAHIAEPLSVPHLTGGLTNATAFGAKDFSSLVSDWISVIPFGEDADTELQVIEKQIEFKLNLALWVLPPNVRNALPLVLQSWLANWVLGSLLYLVLGAIWCLFVYKVFKNTKAGVPAENIPAFRDLVQQILVSQQAMPLYTLLPVLTEHMITKGWTLCYARISTHGWPMYFVQFCLYMASVEFGVYWMHRKLHELKLGYKYLHATHHQYNKNNTLSPYAGLAFNPIDGILQAAPYMWTLYLVPFHFLTQEILLFGTAVWTTSIHDCVDAGCEPIMGAGYHTIHHTDYKFNYGHYTIFMDKWFGTLRAPPGSKMKAQ